MELYQINYEFNPPREPTSPLDQQQATTSRQRTKLNSQKRLKQLSKHFYTNFSPYRQYFNAKPSHITLHKSKPQFYLHSNLYDRERLLLERQSMYYRGAVDEFLNDDLLKPFVEEDKLQKGFVQKKGNKSLVYNEALYYAHQSTIKAIQLPKMRDHCNLQIYQQSQQPLLIVSFQTGSIILEIQQIKNHILNSTHEGLLLLVRFTRQIVIYSVKYRKTIQNLESSAQFTQMGCSVYNRSCFQTTEQDGVNSILSTFQIQQKEQKIIRNRNNVLSIPKMVNSKIGLNRNECLLTIQDGLYLLDRRVNKEIKLHEVKNLNKQRFYSSIPLKGAYNFSPMIASCQSRFISIFDVRKPQAMVKKYFHQCEEAPPQILNFYDGTTSHSLFQPILTCHSAYSMGSSLLMPLNPTIFQDLNTGQGNGFSYYTNHANTKKFTLLYDSGKSSNESALHSSYNESISVFNLSSDQFQVIKVDNEGSITMELFSYNELNEKYEKRQFHDQSQAALKLNSSNQMNPSQIWLQNNLKNKYLLIENEYQKNQIEVLASNLETKKQKKASKKKKAKTSSKNQKKKLQLKQLLTEVDGQQFLEGEYQNSQECQQSLAKRKVNFVDLTQFFATLQEKAKYPQAVQQKKQNQLEFSLSSTQANSEGYNFSQSFDDNSGTKALSFHNKKLMNFAILEKLKKEWDD